MQAKDVDDRAILAVVHELAAKEGARHGPQSATATSWDVCEAIDAPKAVVRAKLAAMARRKLIDGCACGCRGDFALTETGKALLAERPP